MSDSLSPFEIQNRNAYDRMARNQHVLAQPVSPDELKRPLDVVDGRGWLGGSIRGWRVLCLAAGGGRHSILYSAAGAEVTVVDISDGMLELDRAACEHYKFSVRLIQASMLSMPMLRDSEFDLVIHPVSTCYVQTLAPVFEEVSRVLRPGGLYVSQHKSPFNLQTSLVTHQGRYCIETEVGGVATPVPRTHASPLRETDATEIAHSLEDILGGICRAGMFIEDLSEPDHAKQDAAFDSSGHRARFIRPYIRVKARRVATENRAKLILP
ncbi:MAG: class I SAM-dependent methyltransferase [Pirellula sp.]|nr:class I SAM-dependent methyltransferase [Pirellula sp.]